jgi:sulfate-transporting ATPase
LLYINLVLALLLIPTLIQYPNGLAAWLTKALPSAYRRLRHVEGPAELAPGEEPAAVEAADSGDVAPTPKAVTRIEPVTPRVLSVKGITVRYGGVQALSEVSLEVKPGQVVGLMGPNGAGKTTLIDAVTGFASIAHGTIEMDGHRIDKMSPRRRARAGLARTFQSLELFDQLTVRENLRAASDRRDTMAYLTDLVYPVQQDLSSAALLAIETFELEDELDRLPTELPYGRRRQVALARSIATEPSVLLLDEPAAGLNATETHEFATSVRRLADDWGMGILLVEHDVPMLNQVCDQLVVIDFGLQIAEGTPDEIRTDPRVIAAYLGDAPDPSEVEQPHPSEDVASGAN